MQRNGDIQNQQNTDLPKVVTVKLMLFSASHVDRTIRVKRVQETIEEIRLFKGHIKCKLMLLSASHVDRTIRVKRVQDMILKLM